MVEFSYVFQQSGSKEIFRQKSNLEFLTPLAKFCEFNMVKNNKKSENVIFYPDRCEFYIDTNRLLNTSIIKAIVDKFDDATIKRLNQVITGIKFNVGGRHQWHYHEKGYQKFPTYEFNFNDRTILFYLSKIFKEGYEKWSRCMYGSLRRNMWDSLCYEMVMCAIRVIGLNLELVDEAKECYLNMPFNEEDESYNRYDDTREFIYSLYEYDGPEVPQVDYVSIHKKLLHECIPKNLGFIEALYNRKLGELKKKRNQSQNSKIKLINELRKIKLGYEYEYTSSELVNYCIYHQEFEIFFRYNYGGQYKKLQRQLYYKAKRVILNYFKTNDIQDELIPYKDSANRTYFFLTHLTFMKVKDACLEACVEKIKNKHLDQYTKFKEFYYQCPICKIEDENQMFYEKIYFTPSYNQFREILLQGMEGAKTMDELNDGERFFGVVCEHCFSIVRNIQGTRSDLEQVNNFILTYKRCPVCTGNNHSNYLLDFYYNDSRKDLREYLIQNMELATKFRGIKINIGIPCCHCFEKVFEFPHTEDILDLF